MLDRELLERAAEAVGFIYHPTTSIRNGLWGCFDTDRMQTAYAWAPLTSDGDCARMESALRLNVIWYTDAVRVWADSRDPSTEYYHAHKGDKNAARRRASTRAAAEIGQSTIEEEIAP